MRNRERIQKAERKTDRNAVGKEKEEHSYRERERERHKNTQSVYTERRRHREGTDLERGWMEVEREDSQELEELVTQCAHFKDWRAGPREG